jgi:hypothetical protein
MRSKHWEILCVSLPMLVCVTVQLLPHTITEQLLLGAVTDVPLDDVKGPPAAAAWESPPAAGEAALFAKLPRRAGKRRYSSPAIPC